MTEGLLVSDNLLADAETIQLDWRDVLAPQTSRYTYADWVRALSDESGVYLIRSN
ncbi:MAG: hypothetical protein MJE77_17470 [Proteobacteria bacterium]|nr:hypothetical protein [Pseudomonadota bacterium]